MQFLAEAIVERAARDWISLDHGKIDSLQLDSTRVKRDELIEFFSSSWFEELLECFTVKRPEEVREWLKVPAATTILKRKRL